MIASIVVGSSTTVAMGACNGVSETVGDAFCGGRATDGQLLRYIGGAGLLLCGD